MLDTRKRRRQSQQQVRSAQPSCGNNECEILVAHHPVLSSRRSRSRFHNSLLAAIAALLASTDASTDASRARHSHAYAANNNVFERQPNRGSSRRNSDSAIIDGLFFDDAEYNDQEWVFDMIDLAPVWSQGIFGRGVRVRINDGEIDEAHAEFEGRFDRDASCPRSSIHVYNNIDHNDINNAYSNHRSGIFDTYQHGTSVASIVGAAGNNGGCAVGVAPQTTLSWCNGLDPDESFLDHDLGSVDVSQNSYDIKTCEPYAQRRMRGLRPRNLSPDRCPFEVPGAAPCEVCEAGFNSGYFFGGESRKKKPPPKMSDECVRSIVRHCDRYFKQEESDGGGGCSDFLDLIIGGECNYEGLSTTARRSISNGIRLGRNGLGVVYVFASGNSFLEGDDTNLKGYTNSRHTISVGAVGKDRIHTYYSTGGASLFLSAPAGDSEDLSKHVVARAGGGCTTTGIGTSFASPVVSGVVALVLETNRELGWRDVQGILAKSAKPVHEDSFDRSAVVNGGGLWHSNLYGFGIVNANDAVEMAKTWTNYGPERVIAIDSGPLDDPILDKSSGSAPSTSSIAVAPKEEEDRYFVVESVELLLDVVHISRGDLKITLRSPSGTESVLHPGKLPENVQLDPEDEGKFWKLMTVRNREESPFGEWTLTVADEKPGQFDECVDAPGFALQYAGVKIDCRYLEDYNVCGSLESTTAEGSAIRIKPEYWFLNTLADAKGRGVSDACCVCGGGMNQESLGPNLLRHWTLAIYGRHDPSAFATDAPTTPATPSPTRLPTDSPSGLPTTVAPTNAPSTGPTTTEELANLPASVPRTQEPSASPTPLVTLRPTDVATTATTTTTTTTTTATTNATSAPSHSPSEPLDTDALLLDGENPGLDDDSAEETYSVGGRKSNSGSGEAELPLPDSSSGSATIDADVDRDGGNDGDDPAPQSGPGAAPKSGPASSASGRALGVRSPAIGAATVIAILFGLE